MTCVGQMHYTYQNKNAGISIEQSVYRTGSYHYNWHTELEFLVVLCGEIEVCSHAMCRVLQEDDLILINPNSGHATFSCEPQSVAMVLHADPRFLGNYYEDAEKLFFEVCSDKSSRDAEPFRSIRKQLAVMAENLPADTPERCLAFDSAFYSLFSRIAEDFSPQHVQSAAFGTGEKKMEALEPILKYIHKNYRKKISLDALAKANGYNSSYLSQLFKQSLGINFYDYLTRIRLREATRQLSQTEEKILDIALENGFADLKSFNTVFRKTFRKSPTEYRSMVNEEHIMVDLAFKKEYLPADDANVCRKLAEYRAAGGAAPASEPRMPDEQLRQKAAALAREAQRLADMAGELAAE